MLRIPPLDSYQSVPARVERVALAACIALAVFAFAAPLLRLPLLMELPNEGWNATHAVRWFMGGPLYPAPGEPIVFNYLPLWPWLTGHLAAILGDVVTAGRVLSLAAALAIGGGIFALARGLGLSRVGAAFAGALAVAMLGCFYNIYFGLNEPQLLAHALVIAGAAILVRARGLKGVALAAGVMLAGALAKHVVIAMPIAATLWLWLNRRALFWAWLACAGGFGAMLAAALILGFGPAFLPNMLYPRILDLGRMFTNLAQVLKVAVPLLAFVVLVMRDRRRDDAVRFAGLAILAALAEIAIMGAALGVSSNIAFDLIIAAALAAGVIHDRWPGAGIRMALLGLFVAIPLATMQRDAWRPLVIPAARAQLHDIDRAGRQAAALIRAAPPGPVACETLTICVRAGRPSAVDLWKLRLERTLAPSVDSQAILRRIAAGEFAAVTVLGFMWRSSDEFNLPGLRAALAGLDARSYAPFFVLYTPHMPR